MPLDGVILRSSAPFLRNAKTTSLWFISQIDLKGARASLNAGFRGRVAIAHVTIAHVAIAHVTIAHVTIAHTHQLSAQATCRTGSRII